MQIKCYLFEQNALKWPSQEARNDDQLLVKITASSLIKEFSEQENAIFDLTYVLADFSAATIAPILLKLQERYSSAELQIIDVDHKPNNVASILQSQFSQKTIKA